MTEPSPLPRRCWNITSTDGRRRTLVVIHDAPQWIAREMMRQAELILEPGNRLALFPLSECAVSCKCCLPSPGDS